MRLVLIAVTALALAWIVTPGGPDLPVVEKPPDLADELREAHEAIEEWAATPTPLPWLSPIQPTPTLGE